MGKENNINPLYYIVTGETRNRLAEVGLDNEAVTLLNIAVRLGARRVLAIHGASPETLQTIYKADAGWTPRTVADLESGKVIKTTLRLFGPKITINEEETGIDDFGGNKKAHVDPLDGTSSFQAGQRYSTVGAVLYEGNSPQVATLCHPFERELLVAQQGRGAWLLPLQDDLTITPNVELKRLAVTDRDTLVGSIGYVDALINPNTDDPKLQFLLDVKALTGKQGFGIRASGSNIDQQRQVAAGRADWTLTDAVGGFWDLAVEGFIIQEAGGKFTDLHGNPVTEETRVALGSNGVLHDQLLQILQHHYEGYCGFK